MKFTESRRGTAAVVVAGLALTLAGGTTALADPASDVPTTQAAHARAGGLSSAERRAVKKIAKKIARKQIKKLAPTLSVASARTALEAQHANTAQSAVNAQTAANATHALSADMAVNAQNAANAARVGGLDVRKINVVIPADGEAVTLIDSGGFTLTASCVAGAIDLHVASSEPGGRLRSADIDNNETVATQGSNDLSATGFSIHVPGGDGRGSATMEFVSASGTVINAWVGYRDDAPGCAYFGNFMMG